jgi:peptidyl-tRNA hydrolase, PTH1 family
MYLLVGLGNPGNQYAQTRHNFGFMALDAYANTLMAGEWQTHKPWKSLTLKSLGGAAPTLLIKPQTYMNLSGQAVASAAQFYKIPPEHVLVVVDDINLPFGRMRYRAHGSAGGHNGLKSIEQSLGTAQYPRLRLGVGANTHPDHALTDFVLGRFTPAEQTHLPTVLNQTVAMVNHWRDNPASNQLTPMVNGWMLQEQQPPS